jgi:hypothetical protein
MELKEIMAVSGHPGLVKFVSEGRNGIIVEGIDDKKRTFVPATAKVSTLADIAIFTETGEVPLKEVMKKIREKENKGQALDPKSEEKVLKDYFEKIIPDYNKERVYFSDIKKVIIWYNLLQKNNLLDILDVVEKKDDEHHEKPEHSDHAEKKHIDNPGAGKIKGAKQMNMAPRQTNVGLKAGASSRKASS